MLWIPSNPGQSNILNRQRGSFLLCSSREIENDVPARGAEIGDGLLVYAVPVRTDGVLAGRKTRQEQRTVGAHIENLAALCVTDHHHRVGNVGTRRASLRRRPARSELQHQRVIARRLLERIGFFLSHAAGHVLDRALRARLRQGLRLRHRRRQGREHQHRRHCQRSGNLTSPAFERTHDCLACLMPASPECDESTDDLESCCTICKCSCNVGKVDDANCFKSLSRPALASFLNKETASLCAASCTFTYSRSKSAP